MTLFTIAVVTFLGALGGMFGALLGLGGGIFLVPFLTLGFGLPFRQAAGIGLMTVIATSSVVSAQRAGDGTINLRLGIVLEIATTLGGLGGGVGGLALGGGCRLFVVCDADDHCHIHDPAAAGCGAAAGFGGGAAGLGGAAASWPAARRASRNCAASLAL